MESCGPPRVSKKKEKKIASNKLWENVFGYKSLVGHFV